MPRDLMLEPPKSPVVYRCTACGDTGILILVERVIVGITDLLANSAPCTCVAGDRWQKEYA